ncbi:hypothetical protein CERZMDRAFT_93075 [Cercospora zeae-maydis SCOH1-5]|uniref:RBR-type E3 ubiquitin transferase n=1 Tax=Cercospora zeae-maydis SCOH1-5 TaxID=717836 RepID=A0A6A6FUK4_9PEZI|nr:hypothetical protein CERZMDRAFT_93075 [Cercospora zeae-maydis SCOH1-5]
MARPAAPTRLKRSLSLTTPTQSATDVTQVNFGIDIKQESSESAEPTTKRPRRKYEECTMCCEELYCSRFPRVPHVNATENCKACFTCWGRHFKQELEVNDWDKLGCLQCGTILTTEEYNRIARSIKDSKQTNAILQRKATESYLRQDLGDGECFVTCPSSTCKEGVIMADGHIFTCPTCKARYCFSCNAPMHEDMSCEEFLSKRKREDEKAEEETLASKTLEKHSKECPKCKARLQKNGGCDHFTCKLCKHEFCWLCLAPYQGPDGISGARGNSAHDESCRYHSRRLPSYAAPPRPTVPRPTSSRNSFLHAHRRLGDGLFITCPADVDAASRTSSCGQELPQSGCALNASRS